MKLKKFLPAHLGGPRRNIYNTFIHRILAPKRKKPLWNYVEEAKPKRILEIGLGFGYNAKKMMELTNDCEYYCFDALYIEESIEAYDELRRKANTKFYIGNTMDTLPKFADSLPKMDLIFIDGGHDYETVKNDWEHCKRLMHEKTACFFHDYQMPGVRKVVDDIGDEYSKKIIKPPKSPPDFAIITKWHSNKFPSQL